MTQESLELDERFKKLLAEYDPHSDFAMRSRFFDHELAQLSPEKRESILQDLLDPQGSNPNWQRETEFQVDSHIVSLHFTRNDLMYSIPRFDLELAVERGFQLPQTEAYLVEALTNSGKVTFDDRGFIGTPQGRPKYEERLGSSREHDEEECTQLAKTLLYGLELGLFHADLNSLDNYYPFRTLDFDPKKDLRRSKRYSKSNDYGTIKPSSWALTINTDR